MFEKYKSLTASINEQYGYYSDTGAQLLSFTANKTNWSFLLGSNVFVSLKFGKSFQRVLIKKQLYNKVTPDYFLNIPYELKSEPLYMAVDFLPEDNVSDFIRPYLERAVEDYTPPKTFGCCHRYKECSDAKQCLHPNKIYARQCRYRSNLENGHIFYGVNKNE